MTDVTAVPVSRGGGTASWDPALTRPLWETQQVLALPRALSATGEAHRKGMEGAGSWPPGLSLCPAPPTPQGPYSAAVSVGTPWQRLCLSAGWRPSLDWLGRLLTQPGGGLGPRDQAAGQRHTAGHGAGRAYPSLSSLAAMRPRQALHVCTGAPCPPCVAATCPSQEGVGGSVRASQVLTCHGA